MRLLSIMGSRLKFHPDSLDVYLYIVLDNGCQH